MIVRKIGVCRGQAEREFRVEVEAIGHVRHKNLVRLLGYCIEGVHRSVHTLLITRFLSSSLFSLCISPLADSSSYSTKLVIAA